MSLINVQLEVDGPVTQMKECDLVKRAGFIDNEVEYTTWVEYRLVRDPDTERAVHRSAHVTLKKAAVYAEAQAGSFPQ